MIWIHDICYIVLERNAFDSIAFFSQCRAGSNLAAPMPRVEHIMATNIWILSWHGVTNHCNYYRPRWFRTISEETRPRFARLPLHFQILSPQGTRFRGKSALTLPKRFMVRAQLEDNPWLLSQLTERAQSKIWLPLLTTATCLCTRRKYFDTSLKRHTRRKSSL